MIYSKFGSLLTLTSKQQDADGQLTIHATAEGAADSREYRIADLKADAGSAEIDEAVQKLPLKILEKKTKRRPQGLY